MENIDYKSCALSATRSKIAYFEPEDVKDLWLRSYDTDDIMYYIFKDVVEEPKYYYDSVSSVNAYSWIQGQTLHIVFRGTKGSDDIKIDLMEIRSQLFPGNKDVLVHDGFLKQFRSIEPQLLDTIYSLRNIIKTVHFSGHSLGGALATLAAGFFSPLIRDIKDCRIICHTVGCPRLGNSGFVKWWSGKVDESYRFLNFKDPVPLLPVNGFYTHINNGYLINDKNIVKVVQHDIPWYLRILYLPFEIYYRRPIANHACNLYIERLLKLADWNIIPSVISYKHQVLV